MKLDQIGQNKSHDTKLKTNEETDRNSTQFTLHQSFPLTSIHSKPLTLTFFLLNSVAVDVYHLSVFIECAGRA